MQACGIVLFCSAFDTPSKWSSAWAITIGYDQCHILLLSNIKLRLIHAARRVISTCIQLLIGNSHCLLCTYDAEGFGAWDDRSCRVLEENDTDVECGCDHLTHFAILLVRTLFCLWNTPYYYQLHSLFLLKCHTVYYADRLFKWVHAIQHVKHFRI